MKFIKSFLMILGIIFLLLIVVFSYIYFADPLNLRVDSKTSDVENIEEYDHPLLNESQESALEKIGIDTKKIPTSITPELEECFVDSLGQSRVNEIINGDTPSAIDLFKAKGCIN